MGNIFQRPLIGLRIINGILPVRVNMGKYVMFFFNQPLQLFCNDFKISRTFFISSRFFFQSPQVSGIHKKNSFHTILIKNIYQFFRWLNHTILYMATSFTQEKLVIKSKKQTFFHGLIAYAGCFHGKNIIFFEQSINIRF